MNFNGTLMKALGMEIISTDPNHIILSMPVDERTKQPAGFLHGGASVALAETAASIGGVLNIDPGKFDIFGIEINANHIKSKREGIVYAHATPYHIGRTTMVWKVKIVDEEDQLITISRCTVGILPKKKKKA